MASVFARAETPGAEWPIIEGWLRQARDRGDPDTAILAPDETLFVGRVIEGNPPVGVPVGAATASLAGNGVTVVLAGGETGRGKRAILPILNAICAWGRANGAQRAFCTGRKGWDRVSPFRAVKQAGGLTYYELEL